MSYFERTIKTSRGSTYPYRMRNSLLREKILGCISGAALGDSMAGPMELLHHKAIKKHFGDVNQIDLSGAKYSDDTLLRMTIYSAIIDKGGRIDAWDLAKRWKAEVIPNEDYWLTELFISAQLHMGISPRETGHHNIRADDAAMAIDPIGVINCCNPRNAAMDARDIAGISQTGVEAEAAIAVAASVSKAFEPNATVDGVVEAAMKYTSPPIKSMLEKTLAIVSSSSKPDMIYDKLYQEVAVEDGSASIVKAWNKKDPKLQKFSPNDISMGVSATEAVPVALGFFSLSKGEPLTTIRLSAGYGRDSDTIAGMGGAIAGAFKGSKGIKDELIQRVNAANNVSLETIADEMVEPIEKTWIEAEECVRIGRALLA